MTSDELAASLQLHPRWVQEWIHNQAAARLIEVEIDEQGTERYSMTPEAVVVLSDELHPAFGVGMFHRLPQTMQSLTVLPESFHTGIGLDYDSHGPEGAVGIERSFEPWSRSYLLPVVLPALDGAIQRLEAGAKVADIGCGAGGAGHLGKRVAVRTVSARSRLRRQEPRRAHAPRQEDGRGHPALRPAARDRRGVPRQDCGAGGYRGVPGWGIGEGLTLPKLTPFRE